MAEMQRKFGDYMGQRIIAPGVSNFFGKEYVWLQDHEGTIYILPLDKDGAPQFA